ncbi:MAG: argininosuccinate lyase [Myxococcales bacterium]|jgi:argininosuccinate lyase
MSNKPWGGRFQEELDAIAARFSASVDVDGRLWPQDIQGSIAHVRMLGDQHILSAEDVERIVAGLERIAGSIERGELHWDPSKEDVHMNIEAALIEAIGEVGGRLHTGRSRNDQVATDMRLWTRQAGQETIADIDALLQVLVDKAEAHVDFLMPGYTHLQRAQPVRLAHHLLAWAEMLERDRGRLEDAMARLNECPLGSAALAGTTFPLDREATAHTLGFDRPMRNSLDAVSSRDFLLEAVSGLAICAVHLSRIAEELVLWSSQEFAFMQMSDAFTTGSSIMPQKKNPDMPELVRGKTGRVVGSLVSLMVMLKGLPLSYNRDLQEDKAPVFEAFDTVRDCLAVLSGAIASAVFDRERMSAALQEGFLDATEVADWLAARGVPFREAHHVAGGLVQEALQRGTTLAALPLEVYQAAHEAFDQGIFHALDMETAVERRNVLGGPARARVQEAITDLRARLRARRDA